MLDECKQKKQKKFKKRQPAVKTSRSCLFEGCRPSVVMRGTLIVAVNGFVFLLFFREGRQEEIHRREEDNYCVSGRHDGSWEA